MIDPKNTARGFIVAGTHTSVGKSSIAMGLMRCFRDRGYSVKPFKVGPDYIDPGHHGAASGNPGYNLDSWMAPPEYLKRLFADVVRPGDLFVVEGMMGLHDGARASGDTGSTAEIARILGLPVLLVIDGSCMARSAAALVRGFAGFDPRVNVFGVLANRVNSPGHAALLKEAIEQEAGIPFLGNLPGHEDLKVPERHLGIHTAGEQSDRVYEKWAGHIEAHLDVPALVESLPAYALAPDSARRAPSRWGGAIPEARSFTVAVARDEAFQFVYQDTLDLFQHLGGRIRWFSPLHEGAVPDGADWVYLPGGYPELHARRLSGNAPMLRSIREFARAGNPVVGECGGLMVLGQSLIDGEGTEFPMAGVFRFRTSMKGGRLSIGYRRFHYCPEDRPGTKLALKGHEFHLSNFESNPETPRMEGEANGGPSPVRDGYRRHNTFAFYSHIYWGGCREWLEYLLGLCNPAG